MNFLNATLLIGAATFVVPLCIHLLNRSRLQRIDWGAMQFLEEALHSNSRSLDWQSWLLLVLRCAIPVLLAACLARPVLTTLQSRFASGPQQVVFVIDDSLSMGQSLANTAANPLTPIMNAKQACQSMAQSFAESKFTLLTTDKVFGQEISDRDQSLTQFENQLEELSAKGGRFDALTALRTAIEVATASDLPGRQIVVASDFRASDWSTISPAELKNLQNQLSLADFPVTITLFPTCPRNAATENQSVQLSASQGHRALVGESIPLTANIYNDNGFGTDEASLNFLVDGQPVEQRVTRTTDDRQAALTFTCSFSEPGWHHAQCSLDMVNEGLDGLMQDNIASLVLHVIEPPKVWIASDELETHKTAQSIALALAPFKAKDTRYNRFQVDILKGGELADRLESDSPQILILCGAPQLAAQTADAIGDLMVNGVGLWVFPTPEMNLDWYRQFLLPRITLPFSYGEPVVADSAAQLKRQSINVPELQIFNGDQAGDLYSLRFNRWFKMQPTASSSVQAAQRPTMSEATEPPRILWQLADGTPLLVAQRLGRGTLIQSAISLDEDWSNLTSKPVCVPWMQQLAWASLPSGTSPNIKSGDSLQVVVGSGTRMPEQEADSPSDPEAEKGPAASEPADLLLQVVELGDDRVVDSEKLGKTSSKISLTPNKTGLFRLRLDENKMQNSPTISNQQLANLQLVPQLHISPELFSVAVPRGESDLQTLSNLQLENLATQLGGSVVASADEFASQQKQYRTGQEIWRALLAVLLLIMFAELLLAKSITRGGL